MFHCSVIKVPFLSCRPCDSLIIIAHRFGFVNTYFYFFKKSVDKKSKRGYTDQADFGKSMAGNLFMKVLLRNLKINEKSA